MGLLNTDINERLVLMKVKTKKENKKGHLHWSAFDEPINGPSKARSVLDLLLFEVEHGTLLSLRDFQKNHSISRSQWQSFCKKYPFFCDGIDIIKEGIYGKRLNMVAFDNAPVALMRQLSHYSEEHHEFNQKRRRQEDEFKKELQELENKHKSVKDIEMQVAQINVIPHLQIMINLQGEQ